MKTHIAELFSADLKENQMTFDIQEPMIVKNGIYAIVPIDDYKKLVNGTDKQAFCLCDNPDIRQDNTGVIYCFDCKKPMIRQT